MKIVFVLLSVFSFPSEAYAYIDPGSGRLVWQGVIAAIGAVVIFVRNPIQSVKGWIQRFRRK